MAVANALPSLKQHADWVTAGDHGHGVSELIERLVADILPASDRRSTVPPMVEPQLHHEPS